MQLNVKIDDEVYKAAKKDARGTDVRLRHWIESAILIKLQQQAANRMPAIKEILDGLPPLSAEKSGAQLMARWNEGDTEVVREPVKPNGSTRDKKKVRAAKPASKPVAGVVRPKINLSRLLP